MGILGAEAHPLSPLSRSDIPASAAPRYVNVAVDAKTSLPGDEFTYAIPDTLDLRPGHLVQAPFGRRSVRGVVTSLTDVLRVDYVKPVAHLLHPEPADRRAAHGLGQVDRRLLHGPAVRRAGADAPPGLARTGAVDNLARGGR